MNDDAVKVLKRIDKRCPECDAKNLFIIRKNEEIDGVIYSKKYLYCKVCEFEDEYKIKSKHNGREDFEDNSIKDFDNREVRNGSNRQRYSSNRSPNSSYVRSNRKSY